MAKAMALEGAAHDIRFNMLCPTFIGTPLAEQTLSNPRRHVRILSKIGPLGEVEDLMGPVVFLASDASTVMTGTHLIVDGGWTTELRQHPRRAATSPHKQKGARSSGRLS